MALVFYEEWSTFVNIMNLSAIMAEKKKVVLKRIVVDNDNVKIDLEEYLKYISEYGKKVSQTTRSSRRFLREIGMIDSKGNFIKYQG